MKKWIDSIYNRRQFKPFKVEGELPQINASPWVPWGDLSGWDKVSYSYADLSGLAVSGGQRQLHLPVDCNDSDRQPGGRGQTVFVVVCAEAVSAEATLSQSVAGSRL